MKKRDLRTTQPQKDLKIGDLVYIKKGTYDTSMPESRMGLVIESVGNFGDIWAVRFLNGIELNFHEMWIERIKEEK